jgi:methyl-accepting chemotaxis protein
MINELNKVNERLFKKADTVELSVEVLELGILQDAQKLVTSSSKSVLSANKKVNSINATVKDALSALNVSSGEIATALSLVNKLISNTKDLGLDVSSETQKMFDFLTKTKTRIEEGITAISNIKPIQQV